MAEFAHLAEAQAAAVDDAGVVEGVEEDESAAEGQAADDSQVDLESGAVGYGLVLADEFGKLGFEFFVDIEGAVEKTASGATGSVFFDGRNGRLLEARVIGESEVGIGSEHQHLGAVCHRNERVLSGGNRPVVRINALGFHLIRQGVFGAGLVQQLFHFR